MFCLFNVCIFFIFFISMYVQVLQSIIVLFSIQTNNDYIHTFVNMNTENYVIFTYTSLYNVYNIHDIIQHIYI